MFLRSLFILAIIFFLDAHSQTSPPTQSNVSAVRHSYVSLEKPCLDSFLIGQKNTKHDLSPEDLMELDFLDIQKNPLQGWKFLKEKNDSYAKKAYTVLLPLSLDSNTYAHKNDHFLSKLIVSHWKNSVGVKNYELKFNTFARQHFHQYLEILKTGYWPDSDQILLSYLTAARLLNLPDDLIFQATWVASGFQQVRSWQSLSQLDEFRIVNKSKICLNIRPVKALKLLSKDLVLLYSAPFMK